MLARYTARRKCASLSPRSVRITYIKHVHSLTCTKIHTSPLHCNRFQSRATGRYGSHKKKSDGNLTSQKSRPRAATDVTALRPSDPRVAVSSGICAPFNFNIVACVAPRLIAARVYERAGRSPIARFQIVPKFTFHVLITRTPVRYTVRDPSEPKRGWRRIESSNILGASCISPPFSPRRTSIRIATYFISEQDQ